jgi:hypothetical protein
MSPHLDTLSWFLANQSLLFLHNAACLREEATNINFIVFGLTWSELEPTIYHTWGKNANHYTTDVVSWYSSYLCKITHTWLDFVGCKFTM